MFEEQDAVPEEMDCDSLLVELEGARNTIKELSEELKREKEQRADSEEKRSAVEKKGREMERERERSEEKAAKVRGDLEGEILRLKGILDKQVLSLSLSLSLSLTLSLSHTHTHSLSMVLSLSNNQTIEIVNVF